MAPADRPRRPVQRCDGPVPGEPGLFPGPHAGAGHGACGEGRHDPEVQAELGYPPHRGRLLQDEDVPHLRRRGHVPPRPDLLGPHSGQGDGQRSPAAPSGSGPASCSLPVHARGEEPRRHRDCRRRQGRQGYGRLGVRLPAGRRTRADDHGLPIPGLHLIGARLAPQRGRPGGGHERRRAGLRGARAPPRAAGPGGPRADEDCLVAEARGLAVEECVHRCALGCDGRVGQADCPPGAHRQPEDGPHRAVRWPPGLHSSQGQVWHGAIPVRKVFSR
mmetsp:Transcript_80943/g.255416  ORF Transcript_80943/g.255416 Transcript_80943/m.255416 type:complete len:275 (+) Transcript_80943:589-1413(+)